ncbi:MAG: lipoyl synthase [bacterium]|nr:lipoyl synthase [bacterium]
MNMQPDDVILRKPPWLKARLSCGAGTRAVREIVAGRNLHTVCESAHCPNQGECWGHGTATFLINGNVCTRRCTFCAIGAGRPGPLDAEEPRRVAQAAAAMGLAFVVVTSVTRDDLPEGGAAAFAETIGELRDRIPGVRVEVLIPDFQGRAEALDTVFAARPDVLNHNIETVPRLYRAIRPQANYERSLDVLRRAAAAGLVAKSGLMLGLGEAEGEVEQALRDLRASGCEAVTIGQYLRPSKEHHPVVRYVTPAEFDRWGEAARAMGFRAAQSAPLVRSSYHAHLSYQHQGGSGAAESATA